MFAPGDLFGSYEVAGPLHRSRLASLNQPTIGGIYSLEEANGITGLVMDLVEGEELCGASRREPESGGA